MGAEKQNDDLGGLTPYPLICGAPVYEQVEAYVSQPGASYSVDLDQPDAYGLIGDLNPLPVATLEDLDGNLLSENGVTYETNQWLEVYTGNGAATRFWDNNTNGTYWAKGSNWRIVSEDSLWVLHLPGGEERIFNSSGRMIRHQNGWGNGISFTYTDDELTTAAHDNGLTLQFTSTDGHITGVSAGTGASLTYGYTNGLLETVTQQFGSHQRTRRFEYTDGMMTKIIKPDGREHIYEYEADETGTLTSKCEAGTIQPGNYLAQSLIYRSETLTDVISDTRGLEQWTRFAYGSKTRKLEKRFGPGVSTADAEMRGIRYDYNSAGDEVETTRFDDSVNEFFSSFTDYDSRHNPVTNSVAYNTTNQTLISSMVWDQTYMLPKKVENAEGETTTMSYANGSLATLRQFYTASNSYDTASGYTANGLLAAVTNAKQHVTTYTYDANGYPDVTTPAAGPKTDTDYDAYGNLKQLELLPEDGGAVTDQIDVVSDSQIIPV